MKFKEVRKRAAELLGRIGDRRVVEPLIHALQDLDVDARKEVVDALEEIGDLRALAELERLASEDNNKTSLGYSVAQAARQAADKIRQRVAEIKEEAN